MEREAARQGNVGSYGPRRAVPTRGEILATLRKLLVKDARLRATLQRGWDEGPEGLATHLDRLKAMFVDIPDVARRRANADIGSVASVTVHADDAEGGPAHNPDPDEQYPAYFKQDFHYQTGGYLSEGSARLYDVQVETLFYGAANAMRRAALAPIAAHVAGRDQRHLRLVDVACGTGRLLRQIRLAYPAMHLTGIDLSQAYLDEARAHFANLRPAFLVAGNGEHIPLDDNSQDVVTVVFLYHELPSEARRAVTLEIARILKPGGLLVFIDSLQLGDRPGWDGLLETFPERFHEPYYAHYIRDDIAHTFAAAGLRVVHTELAFLAKMMVCRKGDHDDGVQR